MLAALTEAAGVGRATLREEAGAVVIPAAAGAGRSVDPHKEGNQQQQQEQMGAAEGAATAGGARGATA